jgi:lipoate-protein ligase A
MSSGGVWRFLESPPQGAFLNMALDDAIHTACAQGMVPPTVRFYRWSCPAISIGYAQPLARSVDVERCADQGVQIVRRPTGGRAILHDEELTYSVVWPTEDNLLPRDLPGSYRTIGRALLRGLEALGVQGQMALPPRRGRKRGSGSAACFLTSAACEILAEGKKVVGSAQRRGRDAVLQQGSILIEADVERLFSLLCARSREEREQLAAEGASAIGSLSGLVSRKLSYAEVREAFRAGFEAELGGSWHSGRLSAEEETIAERLVAERYGTEEWMRRR